MPVRRKRLAARVLAPVLLGGAGLWPAPASATPASTTPASTTAGVAALAMEGDLAVPAQARAPVPLLDRTGWTATDGDGQPAAAVLDGDPGTAWRSRPAGLAPRITLDLLAPRSVAGLSYLPPRATGAAIARFQVLVSADGAAWRVVAGGTWAADAVRRTVSFASTSARFVRLVAPDGGGAAEVDLLPGADGAPARGAGSWGPTLGLPLVPSSVALLPHGKVLMWSSFAADTFGGANGYTQTAILDLGTGRVTRRTVSSTGHDMFCPGIAILADGRVMVTGGSNSDRTSIYDPRTSTWAAGPDLQIPRGYHAMTALPSGRVFTIGGSWSGGVGGKKGEVWSPGGGWRVLTGVPDDPIRTADPTLSKQDDHAWLVVASGGRLLHAGPSAAMHWISTAGAGRITSAGPRGDSADAMNGSAVSYDVDRVLTLGGAPAYANSPATARAYTIDVRGPTPVTTRVGDLHTARAFQNSVVLPDGTVLVLGGQSLAAPFTDTAAVLAPELWDPVTGQFTELAAGPTPRDYHSVALLLPDGRVLSAGGGQCGATCTTNHEDGQVFTPPYLLRDDGSLRPRPAITTAPTRAAPGALVRVTTDRPVSSFSLVRYGEATHTVDNDQRRVPLAVTASAGTTYTLAVPRDRGVVLPGPYLLFALDPSGTPSVAAAITLG